MKPPYYHGITTALTGREEGRTMEESDPERAMRHAQSFRVTILFVGEWCKEWREFIKENPNDPAGKFVGEKL